MLKKTITYTDYNGVERTEDFYFNLSQAELSEMEMSQAGGLSNMMKKIVDTKDMPGLITIFKEIILKAYGEKSPDGRRFMKSDEIRNAFMETQAYSDLFMELASNAEEASAFMNAIIPQNAATATSAPPGTN